MLLFKFSWISLRKTYNFSLFASCAWYDTPIPIDEKQYVSVKKSEKQVAKWKHLFALYHWWKSERPLQGSDTSVPDRRDYGEETEKLCELMRLREHLWT
jgi:hypothetical protein